MIVDDDTVTKLTSNGYVMGSSSVGDYPVYAAFDGVNIWVANLYDATVTKLRASDGSEAGTYTVGSSPWGVAFDGACIWVVNNGSNSVTKL